jgi:hypothetical protein
VSASVSVSVRELLDIPALEHPFLSELRQAFVYIVAVWAGCVINAERRFAARQRNLPHRHADIVWTIDEHLARIWERAAEV